VASAALDSLLLSASEVDAVIGSNGMTAQPATTDPTDDRDIVTNLNCLGICQADEAEIYENSGRTGLRRQRRSRFVRPSLLELPCSRRS
jgi:hypothetical protein